MQKYLKKFALVAVLYLFAIFVICFLHYKHLRGEMVTAIDKKLITAVHSTRAIMGKNFHDNLRNKSSLSVEQDYQLGVKLYGFAKDIGVEYVYSLKRFGDDILFVASSATEEELALDSYEPSYYTKYPEMNDTIVQVFETGLKQSAEYHDRWGSFRSVYVPFQTSAGEVYVIGADVNINEIDSVVVQSAAYALMMAGLLTLLITPIFILFLKSSQREWQVKLNSMFKDELTGLPNRKQLIQDLVEPKPTHLIFIDIKNFKDVINTYGPAVVDCILQEFTCRLINFNHSILKQPKPYRIGGDVFALLDNTSVKVTDVTALAKQLNEYLENHRYKINNNEFIKLVITVGCVNQHEDAYMLANIALEEAKSKNLRIFVYDSHSSTIPAAYQQISTIKQQLQLALDEDRLVPFWQPIFHARTRELAKYECLARIVYQDGQVELTPDVFIPVARRASMYAEITRRMVRKSIQAAVLGNFTVSVNLSITDIMNPDTREFILNAVKNSKIARRIQFEILETEAIDALETVRRFIIRLQRFGAKVGLDDLGRSYSNFDRLSLLPIDFIKIDGSIISAIEFNADAQKITREIVLLSHKHDIKVTAEYCHNEATTKMAIQLGVDYLQGFYLGKPSASIKVDQNSLG